VSPLQPISEEGEEEESSQGVVEAFLKVFLFCFLDGVSLHFLPLYSTTVRPRTYPR